MYPNDDPFAPPSGDPFGPPPVTSGPPTAPWSAGGGPPTAAWSTGVPAAGGPVGGPPPGGDYNTLAVLSPIFGVILPPAGVLMGHFALPQIRRSGERGRPAAIAGLVIGYLMCLLLLAGGVWWGTHPGNSPTVTASTGTTFSVPPMPSVITSVAPQTTIPHVKVDLNTVPLGTCVEVQIRSTNSNEALDLFKVDCEHRDGVYTVAARVTSSAQCHSVYVASPPDRSFALCLNAY